MSETEIERPRLIVDAWSVFIGGFKSSQLVSTTGKPVGGVLFLMRTIAQLSENIRAKSVDVVWETDGSPHRRTIFRLYKHGGSPMARIARVNRPYGEKPQDTKDNMLWQVSWVSKLLGLSGCKLYNVPGAEADDVIAHLTNYKYRFEPVVILTGDSDMFQLCDVDKEYDPANHETYAPKNHRVRIFDTKYRETNGSTLQQYWKVHPANWALAKAIVGDSSDNIPGITGIGWKRVMEIDILAQPDVMLKDIWEWAANHPRSAKLKWLQALQKESNQKSVERNLKLISLLSLRGNQVGVFETQFSKNASEWMDQIEWMRELNREGILKIELWSGLSCEGRRES